MGMAVLGGGITGACVALELAECGIAVDLYEQSERPVSRASYWNEGKIHLGLVYAQDVSRRSARTMIKGALRFRPLLSRWINTDVLDRAVSDPFIYAVHRTTMVPPAAVEAHFRAVDELYASMSEDDCTAYIAPIGKKIWQRHQPEETGKIFDDDEIIASYRTVERCIDPFVIAAHLRSAIAAAPKITVMTNTRVMKIETHKGSKLSVVSEFGGYTQRETYRSVVNALWQNRVGIDATIGIVEDRPVLHRFKVGLHSKSSFTPRDLPTVTFILGPYGDTVNFGHRAYLSWYPAGHLLTSSEMAPSVMDSDILESDLRQVETKTLDALGRLIPSYAFHCSAGHWEFGGGYITAWGKTGIDHKDSQLHERFAVGVHSTGSYHSVDTGKYTLGPHYAEITCDRLTPDRSIAGLSKK